MIAALLVGGAAGCGDEEAEAPPIIPMECDPGEEESASAEAAVHVEVGTTVDYTTEPPCVGSHYGFWQAWGRYDAPVRPEVYVHNLEHGGMVLLYDCPEGCPDVVQSLEGWARRVPADDGGAFRWIVTPRSGMPTRVAAVAWGHVYRASCVNPAELDAFRAAHYRQAPEDIAAGGSGG